MSGTVGASAALWHLGPGDEACERHRRRVKGRQESRSNGRNECFRIFYLVYVASRRGPGPGPGRLHSEGKL